MKGWKWILLIGVLCLTGALFLLLRPAKDDPTPTTAAPPASQQEVTAPQEVDGLPVGKWVITPERKAYTDQALTLHLPAIQVTRPVYNGTDSAALRKGVGLYDYAQLPGQGNRNVSLAAHRNGLDAKGAVTDHAPFYYIDQLKEGDYLYLSDSQQIYCYRYDSTWVVEPDDWNPIATTGFSCLTLTSCTPIGVSDHRIVVRGVLDQIIEYTSDFTFPAQGPEEEAS